MSILETSPAKAKAIANRCHARSRAFVRYGLYFTNDQLDALAEMIAGGHKDAVPLRPGKSAARQLVALKIDGEWLPVVYEPGSRTIVTFLPHAALDEYRVHLDGPGQGPTPASPRVADEPIRAHRRDRRGETPDWAILAPPTLPALSEALGRPIAPPSTLNETLARMAELKSAIKRANVWIGAERPSIARRFLEQRRDALKAERESLVGIEFVVNRTINGVKFDPEKANDPIHLLSAASAAIRKLGGQFGCPPGEHYDVCRSIRDYLAEHSPLGDLAGDGCDPAEANQAGADATEA